MKRVLVFILSISTNAFSQSKPLFTLLPPKQTGINFSNEIKEDEAQNVLAYEYFYNGGGVAIGDINKDGLEDIFFTANLKSNKLYLNEGDFHFNLFTPASLADMLSAAKFKNIEVVEKARRNGNCFEFEIGAEA